MLHKIFPNLFLLFFTFLVGGIMACTETATNEAENKIKQDSIKISLAEWSLHNNLQQGHITHLDFPRIAADSFHVHHVEYVSQFFQDKAKDFNYLGRLKDSCKKYNVRNILIMVDAEGNLGNLNPRERNKAVKNHKKWVEAAKFLGCRAIRVNGNGMGDKQKVQQALVQSLKELSQYAATYNMDILVENHGMVMPDGAWKSDAPSTYAQWLAKALKKVDRPNCGALPDFGNFSGANRYKSMKILMPYARGISAKTHGFKANGNALHTDFDRMSSIIRDAGFKGYIGVEYEGNESSGLTEYQGVRKTIRLIKKHY